MADQLEKIYDKHHNESHHEAKSMDVDAEDAKEIQPKSLTNINYDCLERIFDYLDLENLLNVSQTCRRLQMAAAAKFSDQYGQQRIIVITDPISGFGKHGIHTINNVLHIIVGIKFCLPFLRCFGAKIRFLSVANFNRYTCDGFYLYQYINQYCANTLDSFSFGYEAYFSNESFPKPFKSVETLDMCISNCAPILLANISNVFPNVRRLQIDDFSSFYDISMAISIPPLEHLVINCNFSFSEKNIREFLYANKHLRSIEFRKWSNINELTMSKLLDMISENEVLSTLKIVVDKSAYILNGAELLRLASEHPMLVKLDLEQCPLDVDDAIAFIRTLNSLELFKFRVKSRSDYGRLVSKLDSKWKHEFSLGEENFGHHIITLTQ